MMMLVLALFCCLACVSFGNVITPVESHMFGTEGDTISLSCSYSSARSLFWYRQYLGSAPEFLFIILHTTGEVLQKSKIVDQDPRFAVNLNKEKTHVDLKISSAKVTDSVMYYCAMDPGGTKIIFGTGTKLTITSKQKKDPDYYQLQGSCLATDFTNHSDVNYNSGSVRYSGKDYQNYFSSFAIGGGGDCPEGTDSCKGSSSQSGDIERDEKINFFSLGLFWLRILFLKTVVFNVLVTFKAWMS